MPPKKGSLPCLRNSLRRILRLKPSFNWILSNRGFKFEAHNVAKFTLIPQGQNTELT